MRLRWAAHLSKEPMRLKMSADRDQLAATAEKFGKAIFYGPGERQRLSGENYLETALLSRTYFEMAEIIARCFRPKRILEVGCAAGLASSACALTRAAAIAAIVSLDPCIAVLRGKRSKLTAHDFERLARTP